MIHRSLATVIALVAAAAGLAGCGHSSSPSYSPGSYSSPATVASRPTGAATTEPRQVRGYVPANLVGPGSGGTQGETANSSYTFASDGRVRVRRGRTTLDGVAVARGNVLTFYFDGAQPVSSRWSVSKGPEVYGYSYYNLQIGGYSYVRDA